MAFAHRGEESNAEQTRNQLLFYNAQDPGHAGNEPTAQPAAPRRPTAAETDNSGRSSRARIPNSGKDEAQGRLWLLPCHVNDTLGSELDSDPVFLNVMGSSSRCETRSRRTASRQHVDCQLINAFTIIRLRALLQTDYFFSTAFHQILHKLFTVLVCGTFLAWNVSPGDQQPPPPPPPTTTSLRCIMQKLQGLDAHLEQYPCAIVAISIGVHRVGLF
jgi:hypothetical protein